MGLEEQYNLLHFFPDCVLPTCPTFQQGKVHQHIFPKQQAILNSTAKYLYCQGGVGSAKSVAFAAKAVHLSLSIPENVGVVSRKDFKLLYKSSWLDIKKTIQRLVVRQKIDFDWYNFGNKRCWSDKRQGDYTTINFHNGSIIYAMQGKAWEEGLGASYGWFWVDDAMESFEEMFIGTDASAGLPSRLRLPHVHYDKKTFDSVLRPHGSLHGMVSSNPPYIGHWLHKLFGKEPGLYHIGEDEVECIHTATFDNPTMGADYAKGLMAVQQKMGRSTNVARRVIFGESIPAYGGVRVFPEFDHGRHVTEMKFDKTLPLVRSWDFGFHHPAVLFSMLYKCEYNFNHFFSLSEISDQFALDVWELWKTVKQHTDLLYKDAVLVLDAGDRAGYRRSDANRDRRGPIRILQDEFNLHFKFRFLDLENSLEYMRKLLKTKCKCGMETILIDRKCEAFIGALEGGYKYSKGKTGSMSKKPIEDRYFADIACAWRYGAENFVKWGVPYENRHTWQEIQSYTPQHQEKPWAWMELTDREFGELLTR